MLENDSESFYTAIGLSILIAQKTSLGKRILAIDNNPIWIDLDSTEDFISIVENISDTIRSRINTSFCFEPAIDLLVNAIEEAEHLNYYTIKFVLFSNGFSHKINDLYNHIENKFSTLKKNFISGNNNNGQSYLLRKSTPIFTFWNLSKTDICNLPSDKVLNNVILVSGFSSETFKYLYLLPKETAYDVIVRIINKNNYCFLDFQQ